MESIISPKVIRINSKYLPLHRQTYHVPLFRKTPEPTSAYFTHYEELILS